MKDEERQQQQLMKQLSTTNNIQRQEQQVAASKQLTKKVRETSQTPPPAQNKQKIMMDSILKMRTSVEIVKIKSQSPTKKKTNLKKSTQSSHKRQTSLNLVTSQNTNNAVAQKSVRDILMKFTTPQNNMDKPLQDDETYCEDEEPVISQVPQSTTHILLNAGRGRAAKKHLVSQSPFVKNIKNEEMSTSPIAVNQRVSNIKHLNTHGMRQACKIIDEEEKGSQRGSNGNKIQILVRVRPFLSNEDPQECVENFQGQPGNIRLFKEYQSMNFKFDSILQANQGQDSLFTRIQGIIDSFSVGVNGTIFAYGQTGAGKTYSIIGSENPNLLNKQIKKYTNTQAGILPRTIQHLFSTQQKKSQIYISFFEIYNDKIFDLLEAQESPFQLANKKRSQSKESCQSAFSNRRDSGLSSFRKSLEIRQENDGQFSVPELRKVLVTTQEEAKQYLNQGLSRRSTNSTYMNNQSSRSHSIFQIYLERELENGFILKSKLRIVDLAGSEKYTLKKDMSQQEKVIRVQELTSINSSLSALGLCISALSEINHKKNQTNNIHVPYRNSKLTRILKDSLDEASNVALIICISPSLASYKETLSTLQFAERAKQAVLESHRNNSFLLSRDHSNRNLNPTGSQISLLYNPSSISGGSCGTGSEQVNQIVRAYEEEKAIRMGLQQIQHEVIEENARLKKLNEELMKKLASSHTEQESMQLSEESGLQDFGGGPQIMKSCLKHNQGRSQSQQHHNTNNIKNRDLLEIKEAKDIEQDVISINIIPIMGGKVKHGQKKPSCHYKRRKRIIQQVQSPFIMPSNKPQEEEQKQPQLQPDGQKRVRFAEKLDNDSSLDSSMRERIEHNLKYNDDTIFDNISIFRDLNGSGIVHPKKVAEKERYPKKALVIEESEDEEVAVVNSNQEEIQSQQLLQALSSSFKDQPQITPILPHAQQSSVLEDQSGGGQEFWAMMNGSDSQRQIMQQNTNNLSQQQISIIEQPLVNNFIGIEEAPSIILNNSGGGVGGGVGASYQISYLQPDNLDDGDEILRDQQSNNDDFSKDFIDLGNDPILGQPTNNKDSSFIERSPFQYPVAASSGFNKEIIDDRLLVFDPPDSEENIQNQNIGVFGGVSHTLILDSQSIIEEQLPALLESSSILLESNQFISAQPHGKSTLPQLILDDLDNLEENNQNNMSGMKPPLAVNMQRSSNASSHNNNKGEEIAFSLSNTFSTIQSLREELAVIRQSINSNQYGEEEIKYEGGVHKLRQLQRNESMNSLLILNTNTNNKNTMRQIHRYAKEADNSLTDDHHLIKNESHKQFSYIKEDDMLYSESQQELLQIENNKALTGIKCFYTKIHDEIAQLKHILLNSEGVSNSPQMIQPTQQLVLSVETIDRAQGLISQLRQELMSSLTSQKALEQVQRNGGPSVRVLELLEQLQQSFNVGSGDNGYGMMTQHQQPADDLNCFNPQKLIRYEPLESPSPDKQSSLFAATGQHSRMDSNFLGQQQFIQVYNNNNNENSLEQQSFEEKLEDSRSRTPEVFKGLAVVNSDNVPTERKGCSDVGNNNKDQTLTLVFDSSDEEVEQLQQNNSSLNFEQEMLKPSQMNLLFMDDKGLNIDPIQNLSGGSSSLQLKQQSSFFHQQNNTSNNLNQDHSLLGLAQDLNEPSINGKQQQQQQQNSFLNNQSSSSFLMKSQNYPEMRTPVKNNESSPKQINNGEDEVEVQTNNSNTINPQTPLTSKVSVHKYWNQYFKNSNIATKNQMSK